MHINILPNLPNLPNLFPYIHGGGINPKKHTFSIQRERKLVLRLGRLGGH